MAGVTKSKEKFNAREEVLTSDMMRAQDLASRDDQDEDAASSRSLDSSLPNPGSDGTQVNNARALLTTLGAPISGAELIPTFVTAAGFTANVGAGSGKLYDASFPGLTADDSSYLVARWAAATLTFGAPSGSPRIDAVVATPALVDADLQNRNVLVDPNTRAIAGQNVFKTTNPVAALSVIAGTPGATPLVPAIPAGAIALFFVYVPTAAATSADFGVCRASWRRAAYPFSAMSGVIGGMGMKWDLSVDPTTTSSSVIAKGFHRVAIDGEILEFYANLDSTVGGFVSDTTANPFGSAAAANWNKPYYIYAVGGRHAPMPSFNTSDKILSPVTLVESTVAPVLSTQRPSAALTVNGVTVPVTGAVYVGLGFVVFNSTRRAGCIMDESFTYPGTANSIIGVPNALTRAAASSAFEAFDGNAPAVVPAISRRAKVIVVAPASATVVGVSVDNGAGSAVSPGFLGASAQLVVESSAAPQAFLNGEIEWPAGAVPPKIWVSNSAGAGTTGLFFRGFDHGVRIFNGQVNP